MNVIALKLSKEDSLIIKGIAIIGIVLHNYIHFFKNIVHENEFSYDVNGGIELFYSVQDSLISFINNFISFYGHYGVVAFFFISGYGLAEKYKNKDIEKNFILKNAIKLWKLFVPILIAYLVFSISKAFITKDFTLAIENSRNIIFNGIIRFLFLGNFSSKTVFWLSGPWWFFSAIMQMYILYRIVFYRNLSNKLFIFICVFSILLQMYTYLCYPNYFSLLRYNSVGWICAFVLGIAISKNNFYINKYALATISCLCLFLDFSFYTWMLGNLLYVFLFIFLLIIIKKKKIKNFLIFTGKLSAYLFVINTFVRTVFNLYVCDPNIQQSAWMIFSSSIFYLLVCYIIAYIYMKINIIILITLKNLKISC